MKTTVKKYLAGLSLAAGVLIFSIPAFSADYSSMSLQEMAEMRTQMRSASPEERQEFQQAWREKMRNATAEEKRQFGRAMGQGRATAKGTCDGTGPKGHAYKGGNPMGSGSGSGSGFHHGRGHGRGHR